MYVSNCALPKNILKRPGFKFIVYLMHVLNLKCCSYDERGRAKGGAKGQGSKGQRVWFWLSIEFWVFRPKHLRMQFN